jgi:VWFA-related protein
MPPRRIFTFGVLAVVAIAAIAQQQQVFRSDTRLVQVDVIVRNDKGPVTGLTQNDFQVFDNGKQRQITSFSVVVSQTPAGPAKPPQSAAPGANEKPADRPVSATVIFINNLAIAFADQVQSRKRIAEIMNTLPPREPIALYALNNSLRLMTDFTDDPARIARALANSGGELAQPSDPYNPIPPAFPALEQIANQLASWPGHKNLLWVANYFPVPDQKRNPIGYLAMLRTVKALNAANVAVYPITAAGVTAPPLYSGQASSRSIAAIMAAGRNASQGPSGTDQSYWAAETGGIYAMNTDPGFATQRALEDAQVTYSLGFSPESLDGAYHKLSVKVNRRNVDVRSRQGYVAAPPVDLVAGKIEGAALETKAAASPDADTLNITMQAPYFYSGTNRARVHLALEVIPAGMEFKKAQKGLHGQLEFVGTVSRTDGGEAARFTETVDIDQDTQENADTFMRIPYRYEHEFLVAPGSYVFQMTVGAGPKAFGKTQIPLNVDPWNAANFGIGSIAFSTSARGVPEGFSSDKTLIAAGSAFVPSATNRFRNADRLYFYTEVYEPPAATSLSMQYRVIDRKTNTVAMDSGMVNASNYIHPGNTTIAFATTVPIDRLSSGEYRLEVKAQGPNPDAAARTADFEILPRAAALPVPAPLTKTESPHPVVTNDPLIESARKGANAYVDSLPDYIVKRSTTRYGGNRPSVTAPSAEVLHWRILNVVAADVADVQAHEVYTNIRVNDKPEKVLPPGGIWSYGEFTSDLIAVFGEKTAAVFSNPRSDSIRKRPVAVYDFSVDQPHSVWSVAASEGKNDKPDTYFPAYSGTVWIDRETGQPLRVSMQARDLPPDFPLDSVLSVTDFDFVKIGDGTYLVPVHSDAYSCHHGGTGCFRNENIFRDYNKFTAGSTITFDK